MTRLDHNRALAQLAEKTESHVTRIRRMIIWGNHSSTQYPDLNHATVDGKPARKLVDEKWVADTFIPVVQQRGAVIIKARGSSSAASAASAAIDHVRDWIAGTVEGDWTSMAVPSDGSYGIKEGIDRRLQPGTHGSDRKGIARRTRRREGPDMRGSKEGGQRRQAKKDGKEG
jgi:malate dehydrogenase